jgi:hypothetical protein
MQHLINNNHQTNKQMQHLINNNHQMNKRISKLMRINEELKETDKSNACDDIDIII